MKQKRSHFEVVVYLGIIIIFTSVFFIHIIFNTYIDASMALKSPTESLMFFLLTFLIIIGFLTIIEFTIYMIFKELEGEMKSRFYEKKKFNRDVMDMIKTKEDLMSKKKMLEKKFYERKIDQDTYNKLRQRYDAEIIDVDTKLENKENKFSNWLKWL